MRLWRRLTLTQRNYALGTAWFALLLAIGIDTAAGAGIFHAIASILGGLVLAVAVLGAPYLVWEALAQRRAIAAIVWLIIWAFFLFISWRTASRLF